LSAFELELLEQDHNFTPMGIAWTLPKFQLNANHADAAMEMKWRANDMKGMWI
jgi:hypothetical protein